VLLYIACCYTSCRRGGLDFPDVGDPNYSCGAGAGMVIVLTLRAPGHAGGGCGSDTGPDGPEHADLFSSIQVQVGKKIMRTHNSLLVSLPGADGMKTGFICESGFNVVASATRGGRKLVAVVLGEPSVASRNDRATELLENGFQRYFWKSLFGSSLDGLAMQASLSDGPTHLRDSVCGVARAKSKLKRSATSKLHGPDSPGNDAPADAPSEAN
jgi:hypothetical protein